MPPIENGKSLHRSQVGGVCPMKAAPFPVVYSSSGFTCIDNDSERAAQVIRIFDVLLIGPAMLYASAEVRSPLLKIVLAASGAGTMYYNYRNWVLIKKTLQEDTKRIRSCS